MLIFIEILKKFFSGFGNIDISNIKKKDDCTKAKWYRGILDEGKSAKVDCNTRVALCDSYHQNNCIKKYIKHKCSSLKTKKECNQQPSCTWN